MQENLEYVVITGASSGIGRAAAKAFAGRRQPLALTARSIDRLEALREEILREQPGLPVLLRTADLSVPGEEYRLYDSLWQYPLRAWINNAGTGHYGSVARQDLAKIERLLRLDITALTVLSTLFVRDYKDKEGAQLINVSSCGGYLLVPDAVTYCAAKFYVSAFTEGLARELQAQGARLRAKVFAPAATATNFGRTANDAEDYDYSKAFGVYHSSAQVAELLLRLYDSDAVLGAVDRESFAFALTGPRLAHAWASRHNQQGFC